MIGADHSQATQWGSTDDTPAGMTNKSSGHMQVYLDKGIKPYLAVTTSSDVDHSPTAATGMGWANLATLAAAGVEMLSHGHDHVQRWDRLTTGFFVNYGGAGTGTIQISSTQIVLTGSGGADDATLTRPSYTTIADVIAAVNAVSSGNWLARIDDNSTLTGTEAQTNILPISGSRNVKGSGAGDSRLICCGGGLWVSGMNNTGVTSTATPVESLFFNLRSNGYLETMLNGVRVAYTNLAGTTFSSLVSTLNAVPELANAGITFQLCDNGRSDTSTFRSHMRGDELCTGLTNAAASRVAAPGNFLTSGVIELGLSQRYIRDRQYQKSLDVAAANGVTFKGFAEPGNNWYPWHQQGHEQYPVYRGTLLGRLDTGFQAAPFRLGGPTAFWPRSNPTVSQGYTTPAHMTALADAMADSAGLCSNVLIHSLSSTGGDGGYALGVLTGRDQDYPNVAAFLARVATHVAAGKIVTLTPTEAAQAARSARPPGNNVFNPKFKNVGGTFGPITNNVVNIPGWRISLTGVGATMAVNADGYLVLTSAGAVADLVMEQAISLDRNAAYDFGIYIHEAAVSSGTGARAEIKRGAYGRYLQHRVDINGGNATAAVSASALANGMSWSRYNQRQDNASRMPIRAIGLQGPYTITGGSNDLFNIGVGAATISLASNLTLTAGSRTAQQIADQINAAIAADANFAANPELRVVAKAEKRNRAQAALVLECSEIVDRLTIFGSSSSCTSAVTLFGGTGGDRYVCEQFANVTPDVANWPATFVIVANFQGSMVIGRPYLKQMEFA